MPEDYEYKLKELKGLCFQIEMLQPSGRTIHEKGNLIGLVTSICRLSNAEGFVPDASHYDLLDCSLKRLYKFISENRK